MSEASKVKWADLDDRLKHLLSIYESTIEILEEADEDLSPEALGEELRKTMDMDEEVSPVSVSELALVVDLYPLVCDDMHREFADALNACATEWKTKYPECETFGDLMASHRSAGRA